MENSDFVDSYKNDPDFWNKCDSQQLLSFFKSVSSYNFFTYNMFEDALNKGLIALEDKIKPGVFVYTLVFKYENVLSEAFLEWLTGNLSISEIASLCKSYDPLSFKFLQLREFMQLTQFTKLLDKFPKGREIINWLESLSQKESEPEQITVKKELNQLDQLRSEIKGSVVNATKLYIEILESGKTVAIEQVWKDIDPHTNLYGLVAYVRNKYPSKMRGLWNLADLTGPKIWKMLLEKVQPK